MSTTHDYADDGSGLSCDVCELALNHPCHRDTATPSPVAPVNTVGAAGGATYVESRDRARLSGQRARVYDVIKDGAWRTAEEVADITGDQPAPVGARIRDFRKAEYGGHTVTRRVRPGHVNVHEYRFTPALAHQATG